MEFMNLIATFRFPDLENLSNRLGQLILSESGSMRDSYGVESGIRGSC